MDAATLDQFRPVGLGELDQRAALLRRVDAKYVVDGSTFSSLCERLRDGHEVLEIDGRRSFHYESTYFDTPELRSLRDHQGGREPRFKVRTRFYADTGRCVFEVKLKRTGGDTDKRQIDYSPDCRETVSQEAAAFVAETLGECGIEPPAQLDASLRTCFRRATLAATTSSDRLTCDVELELARGSSRALLSPSLVLLESKSDDGTSPADRALADLGQQPIGLSKYRAGMELLVEGAAQQPEVARLFSS